MSVKRLELHNVLTELLGSSNVYYQPPNTIKMRYPCIVYARSQVKPDYADDVPYNRHVCYRVTIIDSNPDSDIPTKVGGLPTAKFDRHYTAENLNHDVYTIFY